MTQRSDSPYVPASAASPMSADHQLPIERPAENWVLLQSFAMPMEAELARGRLLASGIEAKLSDQHTVSMAWHLADAMGGIKLRVLEEDLERALVILESEPELPDAWDAELDPPEEIAAAVPHSPALSPRTAKFWWPGIWMAVGTGVALGALRTWLS